MVNHPRRDSRAPALLGSALALCVTAVMLTGCVGADAGSQTIGLLLPDAKTARYESFDRPYFEERVAELGDYDVLYANADQDMGKQQEQAESLLAAGVSVLVLDPVDAEAAVSIVNAASGLGVPVVSYDRLIAGGDVAYYVSFDNDLVGVLQAQALVNALATGGDGGILMVNGSPTDSNAPQFEEGALSVIESSHLEVLASYDTPDWSPDKAQEWVSGQIARFGDRIEGVYAANDGTASGAISALRSANVSPLPLVTGQDAELAAIQRIITGDQFMTVFKDVRPQARKAAEIAVALAEGEEVSSPVHIDGVPATLLLPVAVTRANIAATIVADGFWTLDEICTENYARACADAELIAP
ncbi:substrate-binding domain-containing protein [Microbacterium sp. LRZ72]|uniref:sugar ABC transporter substrate-binding protein n=1 Tax=Microbacterium sp. LRZ72 TaxID=2942481 RepID=UPI0029A9C42F|nr:substrate-binding domain-containing protein [Microbacterium sp. LRZ72]MDX2376809.1 substrate-binding domain-containing protein [Microbacterium sp. LRZ72]